jgi:hypothetical protein
MVKEKSHKNLKRKDGCEEIIKNKRKDVKAKTIIGMFKERQERESKL